MVWNISCMVFPYQKAEVLPGIDLEIPMNLQPQQLQDYMPLHNRRKHYTIEYLKS